MEEMIKQLGRFIFTWDYIVESGGWEVSIYLDGLYEGSVEIEEGEESEMNEALIRFIREEYDVQDIY